MKALIFALFAGICLFGPVQSITGGSDAILNQFPWMVSLRFGSGSQITMCGGSLIHPEWVLTSAGCLQNFNSVILGFGSNAINAPTQSQYQVSSSFIIHPSLNAANMNNNIALVRLAKPVTLTSSVRTIQLARESHVAQNFMGAPAILSGWGSTTTTDGNFSNVLKWVNMATIVNSECSTTYNADIVKDTVLCAVGWNALSQNGCQGDAGDPLIILENGNATQIGVLSFLTGRGCTSGDPAGFTRIASYVSWIQLQTGILARP